MPRCVGVSQLESDLIVLNGWRLYPPDCVRVLRIQDDLFPGMSALYVAGNWAESHGSAFAGRRDLVEFDQGVGHRVLPITSAEKHTQEENRQSLWPGKIC